MFFVYYLFACLIIFLHFCICNVSFMLANNRILVFTLELFLFLKFITMFLPVNIRKFCKQHFNFNCKGYIWKQPFKAFSLIQSFYFGIPVEFSWGLIFGEAAGCMSAILVETRSFVGVCQVFCCERLFWGNCPQ